MRKMLTEQVDYFSPKSWRLKTKRQRCVFKMKEVYWRSNSTFLKKGKKDNNNNNKRNCELKIVGLITVQK